MSVHTTFASVFFFNSKLLSHLILHLSVTMLDKNIKNPQ